MLDDLGGFHFSVKTDRLLVSMGVAGPVKQAYLHSSIPTEQRASVVSFDSMMANAGGVVGQSGLGYLSRVRSIGDAYVFGGLLTILALPVLFALRRRSDSVDIIIGRTAGSGGTCAPQGIPAISQVDDTPVKEIP